VSVDALRFEGVCHEFFGAAAVLDQAVKAQDHAAAALKVAFRVVASAGSDRAS